MTASWTVRLCDDLEKVRSHRPPRAADLGLPLTGFVGERLGFQIATLPPATAKDRAPGRLEHRVRCVGARTAQHRVALVPVQAPAWRLHDDEWIDDVPGLYPDALTPVDPDELATPGWNSTWVDVTPQAPGTFPVEVDTLVDGEVIARHTWQLAVLDAQAPRSRVSHVEWFHTDCLAEYYGDDVWSEAHWRSIDSFVGSAADMGVTAVLTPLWTPMLDIAPGNYRTTTQLLDIHSGGGDRPTWAFGTARLERWLELAHRHGLRQLEVPHLFTQWGAAATPRFVVDGQHRFGWGTPATDPTYRLFLHELVPFLRRFLDTAWPGEVLWHLSDEPSGTQRDSYAAARAQLGSLLEGARLIDALSDPAYIDLVDEPVVATDAVPAFLAAGHPARWVYHCVSQSRDVANRFIAQPMARHRALALHLHAHRAAGFLHWGFNFYRTQYGRRPVDPWRETAAGGAFLSGDPFVVYPGPGRTALPSLRHRALSAAWSDLALFEAAARSAGQDRVDALLAPYVRNGFASSSPAPDQLRRLRLECARLTAEPGPHSPAPSSSSATSPSAGLPTDDGGPQ